MMTQVTMADYGKVIEMQREAIAELLEALIDLRFAAKPDSAVFVYDRAIKKADEAIRKAKEGMK